MRTKIELLELLKNEIKVNGCLYGLCIIKDDLYYEGKINLEEDVLLYLLIRDIKPVEKQKETLIYHWNLGYYWNPGELKPRIKAIDKKIKKLRDENQ